MAAILAYQRRRAAARLNFYSDVSRISPERIPASRGQQIDVSCDGESYRAMDYATATAKTVIAGQLSRVWSITEEYVRTWVGATYSDDQSVVRDRVLRKWIKASSRWWRGNVRGLPRMDGKASLIRVLTSLLYRGTVHGNARLLSSIHPAGTFVSNFPPCLQRTDIPKPIDAIDVGTLLSYLPKTGTLGVMVNFYFIFTFSQPYEPLISNELFFGDDPQDPRNVGLVKFREAVADFIRDFDPTSPQLDQWPLNIET